MNKTCALIFRNGKEVCVTGRKARIRRRKQMDLLFSMIDRLKKKSAATASPAATDGRGQQVPPKSN